MFDEAQRWPDLFSWLQGLVDEDRRPGRFVLTGSQQFGLLAGISQSLAGRLPTDVDALMLTGGFPVLHGQNLSPLDWFPAHVATYVERDVHQLLNVQNLPTFQRFVRLAAALPSQFRQTPG